MIRMRIGILLAGALVVLALVTACSSSKQPPAQATAAHDLAAAQATLGTVPTSLAKATPTSAPAKGTPTPTTHRLEGTVSIVTNWDSFGNFNCRGNGGYSDIREGAQVVVKDGEGKILATGMLALGTYPSPDAPDAVQDPLHVYYAGYPSSEATERASISKQPPVGQTATAEYWYKKESTCKVPFAIPAVPDTAFYTVEVSHRGQVAFSQADLSAKGWKVALSLQ